MPTLKEKIMEKKIKKLEARIVHLLNDTVQKCRYNDLLYNNMEQEAIIEYLKEENEKLKEENQKLKEKGKCHKDKRITVRSCDDRAEYNRQVMYLNTYPDCEFIPERKWTKKSKQGSSSDIQTVASQ